MLPVPRAGRTLDPGSDSELAVPECGVAVGASLGARRQSLCSWGVLGACSIRAASPLALRGLSCHPNSRWSGNEGSLQYQPGENLIQLAKHRVRKACGLTHVILLGGVGFQRLRTNSWARAGTGQWSFVVFLGVSFPPRLTGLGAFLLHPCHTVWLGWILSRDTCNWPDAYQVLYTMCHSGQVQLWWHKPQNISHLIKKDILSYYTEDVLRQAGWGWCGSSMLSEAQVPPNFLSCCS